MVDQHDEMSASCVKLVGQFVQPGWCVRTSNHPLPDRMPPTSSPWVSWPLVASYPPKYARSNDSRIKAWVAKSPCWVRFTFLMCCFFQGSEKVLTTSLVNSRWLVLVRHPSLLVIIGYYQHELIHHIQPTDWVLGSSKLTKETYWLVQTTNQHGPNQQTNINIQTNINS